MIQQQIAILASHNSKPSRFEPVVGIASKNSEDFVAAQTHHGRIWLDFASYCDLRWEESALPEGQLVAQHLHWDAVVERHTIARKQTTDDG